MATLRIWETVRNADGLPLIVLDERTTYQAVTFTTATQSNAFDEDTSVITVVASAAAAIAVGENPTASADSYPLAADTPTDFRVQPGQRLSVIAV